MAIFQLKAVLVMAGLVIPVAACSEFGFHSWDWHQKPRASKPASVRASLAS